jgi:CTP synthase
MSVREALQHAAIANDVEVEIGWVHAADLEKDKGWDVIQSSDGILVPGGFGSRGIEGKILAARYAREKKVPYLGLCLGMQTMCIDFARGVLNHEDANSAEFDRGTEYPVIDLMLDQRSITDMGGNDEAGLYP